MDHGQVDHGDDSGACGYTHFTAVRDTRGDLLVASVDDFFSAATVAELRDHAVNYTDHGGSWNWADIHPNMQARGWSAKGAGMVHVFSGS